MSATRAHDHSGHGAGRPYTQTRPEANHRTALRPLSWAIVGAAWGLASALLAVLSFAHVAFFDDLFDRLQWLMPVWWATRIVDAAQMRFGYSIPDAPDWAGIVFYSVLSSLLGAGAMLLLWWVAHVVRLGLTKTRRA
jgi:hypothetical protein